MYVQCCTANPGYRRDDSPGAGFGIRSSPEMRFPGPESAPGTRIDTRVRGIFGGWKIARPGAWTSASTNSQSLPRIVNDLHRLSMTYAESLIAEGALRLCIVGSFRGQLPDDKLLEYVCDGTRANSDGGIFEGQTRSVPILRRIVKI
jgi:hypothetical protein